MRARIDWKYALGLELTDPGFDYSVLSEFRSRITVVREVNRLERCIETMRAALNALSLLAPVWVSTLVDAQWFDRYSDRPEQYRLSAPGAGKRIALAEQVGADGFQLMMAVFASDAPAHLDQVEAVEVLRQTWVQEYAVAFIDGRERVVWRHPKDCPIDACPARCAERRIHPWIYQLMALGHFPISPERRSLPSPASAGTSG